MLKTVLTVALVAVLGVAAFGAYSLFRKPAAPSAPVVAVPLAGGGGAAAGAAYLTRFEINQSESRASFIVDEIRRGSPFSVAGSTDQVAAQIAMDPLRPSTAMVGTIQVNARALATDSRQRDRAIKNQVLHTDRHEHITFTPTSLSGLPDRVSYGQPYTFRMTGDLTIGGVTRSVTFDVTVTPVSESRLRGSAASTVRYADWEITIPEVPSVAGVSDDVRLQLDFAADAL